MSRTSDASAIGLRISENAMFWRLLNRLGLWLRAAAALDLAFHLGILSGLMRITTWRRFSDVGRVCTAQKRFFSSNTDHAGRKTSGSTGTYCRKAWSAKRHSTTQVVLSASYPSSGITGRSEERR